MDAPGRQAPRLKGVHAGQTLMQDRGRNAQGNRRTDTLDSGPNWRHRETRGSVWAALVACLSLEDCSQTVECSTRGCKVGVGGRPLRSVQRETAGCPELPDASRRDAREVIEGLCVCARWDMWGDTFSPRRGVGAPRSKEQRQVKSSLGQQGARAPEPGLEKDF